MPSFIIARIDKNDRGFEEYRTSENPYVHRKEDHALQRARHLARAHNCEFAVFRRVAVVGVVDEPPSREL